MNNERSFLKKYNIIPTGYEYKDNVKIIETKNNKYVLKRNKNNVLDIFNYLHLKNFNYFPNVYNKDRNDLYEIYEYIDSSDMSNYEKSEEIIYLLSLLHNKTTSYKDIDIDDYKKIYEDINNKLNELEEYYVNLNDEIDKEIYMSPSNYLLVRNITKIYSAIYYCKTELEEFYNIVKDNPKKRVSLIHNNIDLSHLLRNENSYLISWDNAKFDIPVYDLIKFYKKNYNDVDFTNLFKLYESKYPLHNEERKLLFISLSIPDKLDLRSDDEFLKTKKVNDLLLYLQKTDDIILQYNSN